MMRLLWVLLFFTIRAFADVTLGVDAFFEDECDKAFIGKRIGLITNHTAVNKDLAWTVNVFTQKGLRPCALFSPEHGFYGNHYAEEAVADTQVEGISVFSLHGKTRRPTKEMLQGIDVLIYDIQDIGSRSYTYLSTLFYCMEEAAKYNIPVIVLDRPNPMGGEIIDGAIVNEKWRSFLGYINIPYCHGMTVGECAAYFNAEYKLGVALTVVPMKGWKRSMSFEQTGLSWVPTSPQIPESDTCFYYPATGVLGELPIVSIGVGYTLPFKVVGAPWIDAKYFAAKLNEMHIPGVQFHPFYFRPFFSRFKNEACQGVKLVITDHKEFLPYTTQYTILGVIKSLYPEQFKIALESMKKTAQRDLFNKLNGTEEVLEIMENERYFIWKLKDYFRNARQAFACKRAPYLIY